MKRIAMVLVTALLAITSVFSAQTDKATAEVSLTLTQAALNACRVGFTTDIKGNWNLDQQNMDNLPKDQPTSISFGDAQFSENTAKVTYSSMYVFYKARCTTGVTLKMAADGPLKKEGDTSNTIDYTVEMTGSKSGTMVDTANQKAWEEPISVADGESFVAGDFQMNIVTAPITAAQAGTFKSNLTLTISVNG